jgi:hypothetical protein
MPDATSLKIFEQLDSRLKKYAAPMGSTDGHRGDLPAVYIFTPDANATWILWEYNPETAMAFGMCDLGLGTPEMGYVDITEVSELRGRFGLPAEIDRSVATRFDGMRNRNIEIPYYLLDITELPKWIVKYVGFYFDMSVEVPAQDKQDALVVADGLIEDEMRLKIRDYSHEILVTPRDEA